MEREPYGPVSETTALFSLETLRLVEAWFHQVSTRGPRYPVTRSGSFVHEREDSLQIHSHSKPKPLPHTRWVGKQIQLGRDIGRSSYYYLSSMTNG